MIPDDFIAQLLARTDIVDVIDKYVKLKRAGQNYTACCPFHNEKTPSFSVNPARQFYHCFGCGVSGSAITFLMEYSGMAFREAVQELAQSAGISMPTEVSTPESQERARAAVTLGEVLSAATSFYRNALKESPQAINYLKQRGVSGEIAAKFGLGYAPDDWQALKGAVQDYTSAALFEAGLVIDNEEGRRYDRFRDRIMFPIHGTQGQVIGFGGRIIGQGEPKYLNSPETPLFEKGRELYGLYQARRAIRDLGTVIVVEGYMDVVALAQNGVGNAVATLGTATTPMHLEKLMRMADTLVFCFDGDKAGRKAAWRALEQSLPALVDGKDVRFLFLPAEDDPDTYVRRLGKDAFLEAAHQAKPLSQTLFEELAKTIDLTSEEGRARLLATAKPLLAQVSPIAAPGMAMMLKRRLADMIGLGALEIERLIPAGNGGSRQMPSSNRDSANQTQPRQNIPTRKTPAAAASGKRTTRLQPPALLIACMLTKPRLAGLFDLTVEENDSSDLGCAARLAAYIRDHDFEVTLAMILEHFRSSADGTILARIAQHPLLTDDALSSRDVDAEFLAALKKRHAEQEMAEKRAAIDKRAHEMGLG